MTATRKPSLTKLESEILQHRLDIPDCICECLVEHGWHEEDIAAVADAIRDGKWDEAFDINVKIARAVLRDAVEGSTYATALPEDLATPQLRTSIIRAGQSLAAKIGEFIEADEPLDFPTL